MKRNFQKSAQGLIGDVLRKVPLTGVSDIRVPSDLRRAIVKNVEHLRENALAIFAKEISRVVSRVDVQHIVDDVLNNYSLRVDSKVDFFPKRKAKKGKK
jgi:hypothetical protein